MAKEKEVDRWEYPDGTPTTKEQRAVLDETGSLPPQSEEAAEDEA